MTHRHAFSLLELIAVLAIMAVVLAVAMPRMQGFSAARRIEHTAVEILAMTRYAQTMAATEGRTYRLHVDTIEGRYYLTVESDEGEMELRTDHGEWRRAPAGLTLEWRDTLEPSERGYLSFAPDGENDVATLRLTDRNENRIEVRNLSPSESFHIHTPREDEL